jgi:hypothetical protein
MQDLLNDVLGKGGIFCGGFVRDYLIRGEAFSDIDFFFPGEWPEPYISWKYRRDWPGHEVVENYVNGVKFNCIKIEPLEFSCNVFCFDGKNVFPRAVCRPMDYINAWELLLQKKYVMQVPGFKNVVFEHKAKKKGWERAELVWTHGEIDQPPATGPWVDFKEAKERFDRLMQK